MRGVGEVANAVIERLGGREEHAAVDSQHDDARERLVVGVLIEITEHLGARLAAEQRHGRIGGDVDEPAE